jgi:hypothetical protein
MITPTNEHHHGHAHRALRRRLSAPPEDVPGLPARPSEPEPGVPERH